MKIILLFLSLNINAYEISYSIQDLENNKIIEKKDEKKKMVLASVSKLYSYYYILKNTELNNTFITEILKSDKASIKDGILTGDLIIKASGDPFITAQNFLDLIFQIKAKGIKKINGNFYISEQQLWKTERLSSLGLEDQADNTSIGPLNFEFNRFKVDRYSNKPIPPMDYLKIEKKLVKNPGLKFQFDSKSNLYELWIKNSKEKHKLFEEVPVRDSTLFSAYFFRYLAKLNRLDLPNPKKISAIDGKVIAKHESLPFSRLMELGLEYSNNLIAEMLLQSVTNKNPKESTREMLEWYKNEFKKDEISWDKTSLVNASGLTLENQTTAENLTKLLSKIYLDKKLKRSFLSFLSISGHSGGIRKRLRSPKNSYRVYAKTGSLFYVNNLAGYFVANSGKTYAFSIFVTDTKKRNALNAPNSEKVNSIRKEASSWHYISSQKVDNLLRKFIAKH